MAKKDTFMLVSLQESQAKHLATVLSNDKSRLILDYLAKHSKATESSLAKKLRIPLSTVHYNLQQLVKGGLVTTEEFHYSRKGREVNHYSLANKYIIIAPAPIWNLKEKLSQILPMVAIAGGISYWIQQKFGTITQYIPLALQQAAPEAVRMADDAQALPTALNQAAPSLASEAASSIQDIAPTAAKASYDVTQMADTEAVTQVAQAIIPESLQSVTQSIPLGWYFFAGFILAVILYLAYDYYKTKKG